MASNRTQDLTSPLVTLQIKSGNEGAQLSKQRVLIIAEGGGTAPEKQIVVNPSLNRLDGLLGATSMATKAFRKFRKYNDRVEVDVLPLANPEGGGTAKATIILNGVATESKDIFFRIGDDEFTVKVSVANEDSDTAIAAKIVKAINDAGLPFNAALAGGNTKEVEVNCLVNGTVNHELVVLNTVIDGVEISSSVFNGGSGSFDSDDIFDNINARYQTIVFDAAIQTEAMINFLEERYNTENEVLDGIGVTMIQGNQEDAASTLDSLNNKIIVIFPNLDEMKWNCIPILFAAEFAAKRSLRLTEGAVLNDLTIDPAEAYGGVEKSSLPYHNTPMSYSEPKSSISLGAINTLIDKGGSFMVWNGDRAVLKEVVTTYKRNPAGQTDLTFRYLNAVDSASAIREYYFVNSKTRFAQTRATAGDLIPGAAVTNALSVKAALKTWYLHLVDMLLVQGGTESLSWFESNLTVKLNSVNGVYSITIRVPIMSQFRAMQGVISINYNIETIGII